MKKWYYYIFLPIRLDPTAGGAGTPAIKLSFSRCFFAFGMAVASSRFLSDKTCTVEVPTIILLYQIESKFGAQINAEISAEI